MPKRLANHEMLSLEYDLIVIGGWNELGEMGSIYKLSCSNGVYKWDSLGESKVPRLSFTAIPLPDDFIQCNKNEYAHSLDFS